jgi:pimeloyl-ACP methyl ester carboxylesterase
MRALFLRGLTREIRHWDGLPEKFQSLTNIPVITLDLPGAGVNAHLTSPKNINEYVEFLRQHMPQGGPIVLIGISMGGMIALRWAEMYPLEIQSVFMINSSAKNLSKASERFNLGHWPTLLKILMSRSHQNKEKLILDITANKLSSERRLELSHKFEKIQLEYPVSNLSKLNQILAARAFQVVNKVTVPVHIIYSLGDRLVDPSCSKKLTDVLKAKTHIHPDAGHDLPLDDPQWLLSVLANNI